ncbi:MAG: hypothetical protein K8F31_00915 [Roseovarius sp.]|nr:hypothetical protein [Roseovarius sp.]
MTRLRFDIPLGILLSVALILGGAMVAAAKTGQPGLTAMTICADGEAATVLVDATGQPVDGSPPVDCGECPVCTLHSDGLTALSARAWGSGQVARQLSPQIEESRHTGLSRPWKRARGPPKEN